MLIEKLEEKNYSNNKLLLKEMVLNIGNPNPYIRDKLVYNSFLEIITKNYLTNAQLKNLFEQLVTNQYFLYKIGSKNDDAVYKRSFSALTLGILINKDKEQSFLEKFHISFSDREITLSLPCFLLIIRKSNYPFHDLFL